MSQFYSVHCSEIMTHILNYFMLALLLRVTVSHCAGVTNASVLCAIPAENDTCPDHENCEQCLTISQYAHALTNETYLNASSVLKFLEGEHYLTENLTLQQQDEFTSLILEGTLQQSRIHFGKLVTFIIVGSNNLIIESLEFLENSNFNIQSSERVSVKNVYLSGSGYSFEDIDQLIALNLTVSNASGMIPSTLLNIQESNAEFTNLNVVQNSGKLIVLVNQSSVQFTGTVFRSNTAVESSSLTITSSDVSFEGRNQFYMNTCERNGGAVSVINSTVVFHHQIEFTANTAHRNGGALSVSYSSMTISGFLIATNNSVNNPIYNLFGGFMNTRWSNITISGIAVFENNYIDGLTLCLGGAISARMSTLTLSGSIKFHANYVKCFSCHGGAIALVNSILTAADIHFAFSNNMASTGGAIALMGESLNYYQFVNNTLHISGTSLFETNQAINAGGAVYGDGPFNVNFTGNTSMVNSNTMKYGSHIAFSFGMESHASFNGRTELKHAYSPNSMVTVSEDVHVAFYGETLIENNTAMNHMGVLSTANGASYKFIGRTIFRGNKGVALVLFQRFPPDRPLLFGEAIFLENDIGISLISSTAHLVGDFKFMHNYGPCVIVARSSNITFNGTIAFESNRADSGPAITSIGSTVYMNSENTFYNNSARYDGGSVNLIDSDFYLNADHKFIENSARKGGALYAINSNIHLGGSLMFMHNHAESGGVFALSIYTVLHLYSLNVNFTENVAKEGGIIYVEDVFNSIDCSADSAVPVPRATSVRPKCFYSVTKNSNVFIVHRDNVATNKFGNILFGGNLMRCNNKRASFDFNRLFGLQETMIQTQNISSSPYQIVLCSRGDSTLSNTLHTQPGKLFSISVVGLDQLSQPVSSVIRAQLPVQLNYTSRLGQYQSKQTANGTCSSLNYRVYTQAPSLELTLYAEGPCNIDGTASVSVTVLLGDCPDGFQLARDECICANDLLKYTSNCNIDDASIQNNGDFWAKGLYDDNGSYIGVMSFPHCPFDYCRQTSVYFTLMDPDPQCARNRSGIMCGQCSANHSLMLGGGGCAICPTRPSVTFALLLLFAVSGIALVTLLTLLRLTVVYGTLNGLIFYANILGSNKDVFQIQGWANVFISWLNLDFGFRVCFYDGMDMYAHIWMQFLFPFYIWLLIGIIIVTSHYSTWMTRRLGSNPVAVLATLILLSYAKLLRTIITVFYYANLELPHGESTRVWLYDGNIAYLRDKHLPLFIFALLFFVFAFLPYSLLLLLGPWLQEIPSEKLGESRCKAWIRKLVVSWYNDYRIQSFMTAYTAPYNPGYHFWSGVFLMLRCVLFLVFASNSLGDPSTNLLAIATVTLATLMFTRLLKERVYKSWWVDALEALFLLNLGILSAGTFYTMSTGGDQLTLAHISVGTSLVLFAIILMFHLKKQVMSTRAYKIIDQKLIRKAIRKLSLIRKFRQDLNDEERLLPFIDDSTATERVLELPVAPTITYISLPTSTTPLIQK